MKTIIYLTISLVLAFQGMVMSQEKINVQNTNASQPLKPISKVKHGEMKKEASSDQKKSTEFSTSEERIQMIDKQIAELEKLKSTFSASSEEEDLAIEVTNFKTINSQNTAKEIEEYFVLQTEADFLINVYLALLEDAASKNTLQKQKKMFEEAISVYKAYELKQIEMSNVFAQINYSKFKENKASIKLLLVDYNGGMVYERLVNKLIKESDFAMQMAMEIRGDADKQTNASARLANYINAEEKEIIALSKQNEVIDVLEKTSFINYINGNNNLVYIILKH